MPRGEKTYSAGERASMYGSRPLKDARLLEAHGHKEDAGQLYWTQALGAAALGDKVLTFISASSTRRCDYDKGHPEISDSLKELVLSSAQDIQENDVLKGELAQRISELHSPELVRIKTGRRTYEDHEVGLLSDPYAERRIKLRLTHILRGEEA